MKFAIAPVVVAALAAPSHAAVIYDAGPPSFFPAVAGWIFGERGSNGVSREAADHFVLQSGAETIRSIHWWGNFFNAGNEPGPEDQFIITIYHHGPNSIPGDVVTTAQILSLEREMLDVGGNSWSYLYSAKVADIPLVHGVQYWIGISNVSGAVGPWGWRMSAPFVNFCARRDQVSNQFVSANGTMAFYLTDDITPPACPGDITGDGSVDTADFNVFATNFGAGPGATPSQGDLTGDGFVNTADFNILAGDFGCGS